MTHYKPPPQMSLAHLGRHLLAEFYECNSNVLNNIELIEKLMCEAAEKCGATIVQKCFHHFSPYGVSGVVVIAESHLAIHTWPEVGYAAVDLFTCGDQCNPEIAYDYLRQELHAESASYHDLKRGMMDPKTRQVVHLPFQVVGSHSDQSHHQPLQSVVSSNGNGNGHVSVGASERPAKAGEG